MGMGAGMLGVLVLALYITSDKRHRASTRRPKRLWIVCPLMLYWVGRLWLKAHRRTMRDDPLLFALTDRDVAISLALLVILAGMVAS